MTEELSIQEMFERMPAHFRPDKANGISSVVQFFISGDGGGDWVVTIDKDICTTVVGKTPTPTLTVSADAQLFHDLVAGRKNGILAFMQGKLRIQGDISLAQKLIGLFSVS